MLSIVLLIMLVATRAAPFLKLLRRTRWILLSLLLIYFFATPGVYVMPNLGWLSPTEQGLRSGGLQLWRIMVLLAALALLLHTSSREAVLSGLYTLMKPFKPFGVEAERVAVRLWLTMRYAEADAGQRDAGNWTERLRQVLQPDNEAGETLRLEVHPFTWRDWLVLAGALALSVVVR